MHYKVVEEEDGIGDIEVVACSTDNQDTANPEPRVELSSTVQEGGNRLLVRREQQLDLIVSAGRGSVNDQF